VQVILASGRVIETKTKSHVSQLTAADMGRAVAKMAKENHETEEDHRRYTTNGPLIADLIDEYNLDPVGVRLRLRNLPGIRELYIGHVFALVVFFSDGYLQMRRGDHRHGDISPEIKRLFAIGARLPLENQMALCNRMFGSSRDVVASRDSEPGFRWLARLALPWRAQ
jgi:hypothetical protein